MGVVVWSWYSCVLTLLPFVSKSMRGMVVIKGRRPDGTVDVDGYDTGEESDEEEGQEVPLDGMKVCQRRTDSFHVYLHYDSHLHMSRLAR